MEELAADRTLGASETAERSARALSLVPRDELPDAVEALLRGHPSMAPLWRLADAVLRARDHARAAEGFLATLGDDLVAASVLAPALPGTLLTISASATVAEVVRIRRPRMLVCMASHPGGEGLRMAGVASAWTETRVVEDEEAIRTFPAEAVVVGADAVTPTAVVNKVGTARLAEVARSRGIPCYAVAGGAKLVPIEVPVVSPFEATPLGAFTAVATGAGVLAPATAAEHAARVELHPALRMLAERLA